MPDKKDVCKWVLNKTFMQIAVEFRVLRTQDLALKSPPAEDENSVNEKKSHLIK